MIKVKEINIEKNLKIIMFLELLLHKCVENEGRVKSDLQISFVDGSKIALNITDQSTR